jgi:DNA polymerase zeta
MCRVSKPLGYLLLSASRDQLNSQLKPEYIAYVQEPPKNIFYDPVIVLDFQSLYPSIMIGYNICYSTCLGKLMTNDINTEIIDYIEKYLKNKNFKKYIYFN